MNCLRRALHIALNDSWAFYKLLQRIYQYALPAFVGMSIFGTSSFLHAAGGIRTSHDICLASISTGDRTGAPDWTKDFPIAPATSVNLLGQVLKLRSSEVASGMASAKNLISCIEHSTSRAPCRPAQALARALNEKASIARLYLSVAQSPDQVRSWLNLSTTDVNADLNSLGSFKLDKWEPLTSKERETAQKGLNLIAADIESRLPGRTDHWSEREQALLSARYMFFRDYLRIMTITPLLQFVTEVPVTTAVLKKALQKVNELGERDQASLKEQWAAIWFYRGLSDHPLAFTPVRYLRPMQELAEKDELTCWQLEELKREYSKASDEDQWVLFAASAPFFFLGGPEIYMTFTIAGALNLAHAQHSLIDTQAIEFGSVMSDLDREDMGQLRAARNVRNSAIVGMLQSRVALPIFRVISGASKATLAGESVTRQLLMRAVFPPGGFGNSPTEFISSNVLSQSTLIYFSSIGALDQNTKKRLEAMAVHPSAR